MLFSEQWLRTWVNPAVDTEALVAQLTMAGLEVDGVEGVAGEFTGVVVAQVLTKEKHPDAEKLSVCTVDVGDAEPVIIVCGAANVAEGLKVPCAKVGAVLPENFKIKKAKLRGVESFGMLCGGEELGLEEQSDGLFVLAEDAPVGEDIREYLMLNDQAIEVDLTPNRGDCLSLTGLAREVGVINRVDVTPEVIESVNPTADIVFPVTVIAKSGCPRYVGRVVQGVNVSAPTPLWMVERLRRSGIRSIDPVVDITNYVLLELGQPMHAFDLNQLNGGIQVRFANKGETLTLLDDSEIELADDILVIADEKGPVAMAGIMGGKDSGVNSNTSDVFLESAFFDPITIAGKARRFGLHTDSSHRFERGVDFALQVQALERATSLLIDICGGEAGPVTEQADVASLPELTSICLRRSQLKRVLGFELPYGEVTEILQRLGLTVEAAKDQSVWQVIPTSYRFDIRIEVDLIEEIGRIYGYDNIPTAMPAGAGRPCEEAESAIPLSTIRSTLVAAGYQEAICYSFVEPELNAAIDPDNKPKALANPISTELSVMRTTLWTGLLDAAQYNVKRQQPRVRLFETGLRFIETNGDLSQTAMLSGVALGPASPENWHAEKRPLDFYDIKGDIERLIGLTRSDEFTFKPAQHAALHPGQTASVYRGDDFVGLVGALHPKLQKQLGLPAATYLFELELSLLSEAELPEFSALSREPETRRDLAFIVSTSVSAGDLLLTARKAAGEWLRDARIFDVYQGDKLDSEEKSLALGLTFQHPSRTLKDDEINNCVDEVVSLLNQQFNAVLRDW